jgi:hypothetical protein
MNGNMGLAAGTGNGSAHLPEKTRTTTLAVDAPAPDFTLPETGGGTFGLSEYRGEWAVALVFLRHTW